MAKKASKNGKMSKKARRKAEQRKKLIRTGIIFSVLIVACVATLLILPKLGPAADKQSLRPQEVDVAGTDEATVDAVEEESEPTEAPTPAPTPEPTPEPTEAPTPEPTEVPEPQTILITAAGDCTFGGCLKHDTLKVFKKYVDANGYDYFFDKVRSIFEQDDLTIINLEGPLTDVGTMTDKSGICFNGNPAWTGIMTGSSIEVCNMANNHNRDMGDEGMKRTAEVLDAAGIGYCAYSQIYRTTIKGARISIMGFEKWSNKQDEVTKAIKVERPNCDILIVNFHWGWEMHYEPMKEQRQMGHAVIDAGADLVIGTHPHVFGGVEQYKGKYIAYSLGNFCFGGHTNPSDKRAMMFQQAFEISPTGEISDAGINILPVMVSGTDKTNDFQPRVIYGNSGLSLLRKIASYSTIPKDAKWIPGSYPEAAGVIPKSEATLALEAQAAAQTAEGAAEPEVTKVPELPKDPFTDPDAMPAQPGTEFTEGEVEEATGWEEIDGASLELDTSDPFAA